MEVERKRLLNAGWQLLPGLGKDMHRSRKEALAYARCKLSPAVGRMMHRGGKERLLDVSCLQPLAEGCAKVGRKRLLTHVTLSAL